MLIPGLSDSRPQCQPAWLVLRRVEDSSPAIIPYAEILSTDLRHLIKYKRCQIQLRTYSAVFHSERRFTVRTGHHLLTPWPRTSTEALLSSDGSASIFRRAGETIAEYVKVHLREKMSCWWRNGEQSALSVSFFSILAAMEQLLSKSIWGITSTRPGLQV